MERRTRKRKPGLKNAQSRPNNLFPFRNQMILNLESFRKDPVDKDHEEKKSKATIKAIRDGQRDESNELTVGMVKSD
jgi:hypothetical protein